MKFIFKILAGILFLTYTQQINARQDSQPVVRFGVVADIQYCDREAANNRYYRNSLQKLNACVEDLNKAGVAFTVNLGDLVDRYSASDVEDVFDCLHKLDKKCYNTTGNHDYGGISDNTQLFQRFEMPAEYYTFEYGDWMFIMLNTNEIALYSNVKGTEKEKELATLLSSLKSEGRRNVQPYNGGISKKQMEWFEKQLIDAEQRGKRVIVLSHHPLFPDNGLSALNDREIIECMSRFSCVKAAISGHHHPGAFGELNGIPFITVAGMIETEHENAYGIVEIFVDKIVVSGKGRTRSYELSIR